MEKECFKCGQVKSVDQFYPQLGMSGGVLGKCKECTKNDVRANYHRNRKYYAAYEKERAQRPGRKIKALEYQAKRRNRSPEVYAANNAVKNALRDGRIIKPAGCEKCGVRAVEAHHPDYSKPLEVNWLCRKHHLEEHGKKAF